MNLKFEFASWDTCFISYACLEVIYRKILIYEDDIAFFKSLNYKLYRFI